MVKAQVEGFKCVRGRRGRPGDTKATGDSKDQLGIIYAHKWLLSRSRGLKRYLETISSSQNACLWLIDSHVNFLALRKSTEHSTNLSKKKDKYNKNNLKAVFLSVRAACLHPACHVQTLIMQCTIQLLVSIIYPFRRRSLKTCCI